MQRAILAGDEFTGVSLMKMDPGLDTGPVYARTEVPIEREDDLGAIHDKLARAGAGLLARELPEIVSGRLRAIPQDNTCATYAKKIENDEMSIDWTAPAELIERRVRAFSPIPGAFTWFRGKRLKIFSAYAKGESGCPPYPPGSVSFCDRTTFEIRCGTGLLAIEELQLEGKRRMPVVEFVKGNRPCPGEELRRE